MQKVAALSIPTGIGADIGGYAGDFGYIAREFSKHFYTIVNPNAVNGGILSAINYNMAYLEGKLFDDFFKGEISITPKKPYETNKIGVIFDCAIKENILNVHLNTLSALKVVQGIETVAVEYTKKPAGISISIENNISSGSIENPQEILDCAFRLIKKGAQAIAVVCHFGEDSEDEDYSQAQGIDPIGGVEAVISHLITSNFKIPAAHAPAFFDIDISEKIEHEKVASEMISSTYLPCIMQGLAVAPEIKKYEEGKINNSAVEYLIIPYDAMGSCAVLSSYRKQVKLIAVKNETKLDVTADRLSIDTCERYENYKQCLNALIRKT